MLSDKIAIEASWKKNRLFKHYNHGNNIYHAVHCGTFRNLTFERKLSMCAKCVMADTRLELIKHPPYSPHLAPSDFYLFPKLKKPISGTHFNSDNDVIGAMEVFLNDQEKSFYKTCIEALKKRVDTEGDCVEKRKLPKCFKIFPYEAHYLSINPRTFCLLLKNSKVSFKASNFFKHNHKMIWNIDINTCILHLMQT